MSEPARGVLEASIEVELPALRAAGRISEEEAAVGLGGIALLRRLLAPSAPMSPALTLAGDRLYALIVGADRPRGEGPTPEEARALLLRFLGAAIASNPLLSAFRQRLISAARSERQAAQSHVRQIGALLGSGEPPSVLDPSLARLSPGLQRLLTGDSAGTARLAPADALQLQKPLHAEGLGRLPRASLRQLSIERDAAQQISLRGQDGALLCTIDRAELLRRLRGGSRQQIAGRQVRQALAGDQSIDPALGRQR